MFLDRKKQEKARKAVNRVLPNTSSPPVHSTGPATDSTAEAPIQCPPPPDLSHSAVHKVCQQKAQTLYIQTLLVPFRAEEGNIA